MDTTAYLFAIGYMIAATALFIFSIRMRRVFFLERSRIFRDIYIGCFLLGLALVLYAASYLIQDRIWLTVINEFADGTLFAGLFFVASFPLRFWSGIWNTPWLLAWGQRLLFFAMLFIMGETTIELLYGIRPLCELTNGIVFVDHAPIYFNLVKIAIILLGGVTSGLTNVYYGANQHSLRSYLLGFGMVIITVGGAITVFSFDERTAPIGVSIYLLGGTLLLSGIITPHKEVPPGSPTSPVS